MFGIFSGSLELGSLLWFVWALADPDVVPFCWDRIWSSTGASSEGVPHSHAINLDIEVEGGEPDAILSLCIGASIEGGEKELR